MKPWKKTPRHRRRKRRIRHTAIRCPHRCPEGPFMGALRTNVVRVCVGCGAPVETYPAWENRG